MNERPRPWLICGALLMVSGLLAAWSAYLLWLPCADPVIEAAPRCIDVFTGTVPLPTSPLAAGAGVVSIILAGAAWLIVTLGQGWSWRGRWVLAGPLVLIIAQLPTGQTSTADPSLSMLLATDAALFAALLAVLRQSGPRRAAVLGVLVLLGISRMGLIAQIADHLVAFTVSGSFYEDGPPGTGYALAALTFVAGMLVVLVAGRWGEPARGGVQQAEPRAVLHG